MIEKTKKSYKKSQIQKQKDFIARTVEELKFLYSKKEFDKVQFLVEKILEIDEKNPSALYFQKHSLQQSRKAAKNAIEQQIFSNYQKFSSNKKY